MGTTYTGCQLIQNEPRSSRASASSPQRPLFTPHSFFIIRASFLFFIFSLFLYHPLFSFPSHTLFFIIPFHSSCRPPLVSPPSPSPLSANGPKRPSTWYRHPSIHSIHTLHILTHSLGRRIRRKALYPRRTPLLCPARPGRTAMEDHPRRDRGAQGQGPEDGSLEHVPPQEPLLPRRRFHQPGVRSDGRVFGQEQAGLRGRFPRFPLIDLSLMNLGHE